MFSLRDLNKIDDLMQEVAEQQDVAQEISDAFSQRIGLDDGFDEVGHAPRHTEHCGRHRGRARRSRQAGSRHGALSIVKE